MEAIPYGRQWIDEEDIARVAQVLRGELITQGPVAEQFEAAICRLTGAKHCVVVANGTAALHLAVAALGIPPGRQGITSTNSFVASANAFAYNGLKPVLADIHPDTFNISLEDISRKLNKDTQVIVPVHFAGQPCDVEAIRSAVGNISIIEDAAHAIGSRYKDGSMVGGCKWSDMTIFSFHPVKTITSGEGGAITTNNTELYGRLKSLRVSGVVRDPRLMSQNPGPWYYEMQMLGFNYRLTDVHCALGLSQLGKLPRFCGRRREIVERYNKAFKNIPHLKTPHEEQGVYSAFHLYVAQVDFGALGKTRKQVMEQLVAQKVGTQVHYIPIHLQPYYKNAFGYKPGDLPVAENYYEKALTIPLYPKMTDEQVEHVIKNVINVLQ